MGISNVSNGLRSGVCTSSTRPTAPYEGQMIYETDTDMVALWNGSAWRYIAATTPTNGTVLQTVYGETSTQTSNSTSTLIDTTLTATITPKSTSSKILVTVNHNCCQKSADNGENRGTIHLLRNGTDIKNLSGNLFLYQGSAVRLTGCFSTMYLDSPASTSALTYKTQFSNPNNTAAFVVQYDSSQSTIVLQEIAG